MSGNPYDERIARARYVNRLQSLVAQTKKICDKLPSLYPPKKDSALVSVRAQMEKAHELLDSAISHMEYVTDQRLAEI